MANICNITEFEPITAKLRKTSNDHTGEFTQNYSNSTQVISRKNSVDNTSFFEEEKSDIHSNFSNNSSCLDSYPDEEISEFWELSSICTDNVSYPQQIQSNDRQKKVQNYLNVMQNPFQFDHPPQSTNAVEYILLPVQYEIPMITKDFAGVDKSFNCNKLHGKCIAFDVRGQGSTGNSKKEKKEEKSNEKGEQCTNSNNANNSSNNNNNGSSHHHHPHHHGVQGVQGGFEGNSSSSGSGSGSGSGYSCCGTYCSCCKYSQYYSQNNWHSQQQQQQQQQQQLLLQQQQQQQQQRQQQRQQQVRLEEIREETEDTEEDFILTAQKKASLKSRIMLSYMIMEPEIQNSALKRAENFLKHFNQEQRGFKQILEMVTETYRIILLPDIILKQLTEILTQEQLRLQGLKTMSKLNLKENRHPLAARAADKIRRFFQV